IFFFLAEDGIRDFHVTGVQTCALPISVPNLDVYGGAMLGYNIVKYSSDGDDMAMVNNYGSGMGLSGFLGSRWFFSDKIGAYAELGYGVSVLNVGLTFKF